MDQGTQEWLAWRAKGIGASEAPAVLGLSSYMTKRELWLEKTGQREPKPISAYANAKGGTNETSLRARYSLATGCDFQPRLAQHDTFPHIQASLDGFCENKARAIEIKFVGKEFADRLPDKALPFGEHWIQVQHQMLASGLFTIDYLWSTNGTDYEVKKMDIDGVFQGELLIELNAFWNLVTTKTDPGYSEDDAKPASEELGRYLKEYKETKDKKLKELMRPLVTWPRMEYNGVTVSLTPQGKMTVR